MWNFFQFPPWWEYFHRGNKYFNNAINISTKVEIFPLQFKYIFPVEIFIPRLKYLYLGGNIYMEIFSLGWELKKILCTLFYLGGYIYTRVKIFIPWLKYLSLNWNIFTPVEIFIPRWKYSHRGQNWKKYVCHMLTLVDIFIHQLKYFNLGGTILTKIRIYKEYINIQDYYYMVNNCHMWDTVHVKKPLLYFLYK